MYRNPVKILLAAVCLLVALPGQAGQVDLNNVAFPEKRSVPLSFVATPIAPTARVGAQVMYKQGQARITMDYSGMKPAILFGGDVTCFVVWAVTRDGQVENLGEMMTRKANGRMNFSTGKKNFAMLVTAESFYLVSQPSELVVFYNSSAATAGAPSNPFTFDRLAEAPEHHMDGIAHIKWDSKVPLDLLQARKAFELAERNQAAMHAAQIYSEAAAALKYVNQIAIDSPKSRELLDSARRAVALSTEALNISLTRIEALEIERKLEQRRQETAALEKRAAEAEAAAQAAEELAALVRADAERVRAEAETVRADKERMLTETSALRNEKAQLESGMFQLRQEKADLEIASRSLMDDKRMLEVEAGRLRDDKAALEGSARRLQEERDRLKARLQSALSHVADTEDSARGLVVNLPDILFDLNEAELKTETQLILAKLAGILLILPERNVLIEGHTDSTGTAGHNLDLSQRRASSVLQFLRAQGLESRRLTAEGHGMQRPVDDNSTTDGRRRNRRVEIVISDEQAIAVN